MNELRADVDRWRQRARAALAVLERQASVDRGKLAPSATAWRQHGARAGPQRCDPCRRRELPRRLASPRLRTRQHQSACASLPRRADPLCRRAGRGIRRPDVPEPVDWQLHSYSGVVHGFTNPSDKPEPPRWPTTKRPTGTPGGHARTVPADFLDGLRVPTPPSLPAARVSEAWSSSCKARRSHPDGGTSLPAQSAANSSGAGLVRAHARSGSARMHASHAAQRAGRPGNCRRRRSCRRHRPARADRDRAAWLCHACARRCPG